MSKKSQKVSDQFVLKSNSLCLTRHLFLCLSLRRFLGDGIKTVLMTRHCFEEAVFQTDGASLISSQQQWGVVGIKQRDAALIPDWIKLQPQSLTDRQKKNRKNSGYKKLSAGKEV